MKKYSLLAFAAAAVLSPAVYTATYVELQPDSPGNLQTGHLNISGTAKATQVVAYSPTTTGIAYGGDFRSVSDQGRGILGNASSPTGVTYGGLFQSFSTSGRGVAGITAATSGFTVGGFFTTNSTDGKGVQGSSNAVTGLNYGVYGRDLSPAGYGVYSEGNMAATGIISGNGSGLTNVNASSLGGYSSFSYIRYDTPYIYITSDGSSLNALKGTQPNTSTDMAGVRGEASGASGTTYGVYGVAASSSGRGVYGYATSGSGTTTGVYGKVDSPSGRALVGVATAATGNSYAIVAQGNTTTGRVGDFTAFATTGAPYALVATSLAPTGYGLFGQNLAATGKGYGTVGRSDSPSEGWGVYCSGRFGSSGTKSFRIDHPLDPFNKYLLHYSTESPTPQNFYSGNVVTDSKGYAWVTLPDYFKEININFKYQLTVVDDQDSSSFVQAKVSKKIRGNQFQIRTSSPNAEVSWRIEADRNDIFVQHSKPSDVEEKEGAERGTVEFPEFYNQPADRGLFYGAKSGIAKQAK